MENLPEMRKSEFEDVQPRCLHYYKSGANSVSCDTHMGSICGELVPFWFCIYLYFLLTKTLWDSLNLL